MVDREPLIVYRPEDRVIDATCDVQGSRHEEPVSVRRASVQWVHDKVLPGLIVLLVGLIIAWSGNEFLR